MTFTPAHVSVQIVRRDRFGIVLWQEQVEEQWSVRTEECVLILERHTGLRLLEVSVRTLRAEPLLLLVSLVGSSHVASRFASTRPGDVEKRVMVEAEASFVACFLAMVERKGALAERRAVTGR